MKWEEFNYIFPLKCEKCDILLNYEQLIERIEYAKKKQLNLSGDSIEIKLKLCPFCNTSSNLRETHKDDFEEYLEEIYHEIALKHEP